MVKSRMIISRPCCNTVDSCGFVEGDYSDGLTFSWDLSVSASTSDQSPTFGPCFFRPETEQAVELKLDFLAGDTFTDFALVRLRENVIYDFVLTDERTTDLGTDGEYGAERVAIGIFAGGIQYTVNLNSTRTFVPESSGPCSVPGSNGSTQQFGGDYQTFHNFSDNSENIPVDQPRDLDVSPITVRRVGDQHFVSAPRQSDRPITGCELSLQMFVLLQATARTIENPRFEQASRNLGTTVANTFRGTVELRPRV